MNLNLLARFTIIVLMVNSSKGAPDTLESARQVGKVFGELADGLEEVVKMRNNDKEDVIALAGTQQLKNLQRHNSYRGLDKLSKVFSLLRRVEAVGILYDLFSGESVASVRHKEILGEFRKQSSNFRRISAQIISQTNRVLGAIWESHQLHFEKDLKSLDVSLAEYENNPTKTTEDPLVEAFKNRDVSKNTIGLRDSMRQRVESIVDTRMDCKGIVTLKAYISALLARPYLAHKIGCELQAKRNNENKRTIESICNTESLPDIKVFDSILDEVAIECGSQTNVIKWLGKYIDEYVLASDSIKQARDKILSFMGRFSYMTFVGVVYSPIRGEDNHWITSHVHRFKNEMNIAVSVLGKCKGYPACEYVKSISTRGFTCKANRPSPPECYNATFCNTWNAKETNSVMKKKLNRKYGVNTDTDLGLFVINRDADYATLYDSNMIGTFCNIRHVSSGLGGKYRIIFRFNVD